MVLYKLEVYRWLQIGVRNIQRIYPRGFPGGAVVKNPPDNAGDTGSSPGPGRSTCRGATKPVCHNY